MRNEPDFIVYTFCMVLAMAMLALLMWLGIF